MKNFNEEMEKLIALEEFAAGWKRSMENEPVKKTVPRIENRNWKKMKSVLKPIYNDIEGIFNLISDRGLKGENEKEKDMIEKGFEIMNNLLRRQISVKLKRRLERMLVDLGNRGIENTAGVYEEEDDKAKTREMMEKLDHEQSVMFEVIALCRELKKMFKQTKKIADNLYLITNVESMSELTQGR